MAKIITPLINEKDILLMEELFRAGHIKYKYAVRLQTVVKRAKGLSTNNIASFLGIKVHEQNIRNAMEEQEVGGRQILESMGRLKEISVSVKKGAMDMPESGDHLNKQTSEFIKISHDAMSGMNEKEGLLTINRNDI